MLPPRGRMGLTGSGTCFRDDVTGQLRNLRFAISFAQMTSQAARPKGATVEHRGHSKETPMITKQFVFAACALTLLTIGSASAGPCNTREKDAGSGPTPGYTGQTATTGSASKREHPPTETMNRASGNVATSSQDAQRQQQGQPTVAQEAEGAKPSP